MLSVVLLLLTILSSYVVVLAGAAAYELTGLDRETAHFQALSAFTGTGFTTRSAERVVNHYLRRRITIAMIILGHAGTATVIASLVTSVNTESLGVSVRNILVLLLTGLGAWAVLRQVRANLLGDVLRRVMARYMHEDVPHEELLLYKRGFGITRVEIPPGSRVSEKRLRDVDLRAVKLQVLAVEDRQHTHAIPDPDWIFRPGQHVVLYGDLSAVQETFRPAEGGQKVPSPGGGGEN